MGVSSTLEHRSSDPICILICQNRTCRKQGSAGVLAAFQELAPASIPIESSGCLGQCGNGPMVLVLPVQTWYTFVHLQDVSTILTSTIDPP
jgi:(2Fe-2S) ferredoxin